VYNFRLALQFLEYELQLWLHTNVERFLVTNTTTEQGWHQAAVDKAREERDRVASEPEEMEGVIVTREEEDEVEEWSDVEGVEQEGLFVSRHAPEPGMPVATPAPEPEPRKKEKGKAKEKGKEKEKGKAKEVRIAVRAPAAPVRSILKHPETVAAEKAVKEEMETEKAAVRKRWEAADFSEEERQVCGGSANPHQSPGHQRRRRVGARHGAGGIPGGDGGTGGAWQKQHCQPMVSVTASQTVTARGLGPAD